MIGYFANGTEGEIFEERYCSRCVHEREDAFCAVMELHTLWNYEQHPDIEKTPEGKAAAEVKRLALDTLIPRTAEGWNMECRFFTKRAAAVPQEQLALELGVE